METLPPGGFAGGRFRPLGDDDARRIHQSALHVLETVGMGILGEMPEGAHRLVESGARINRHGRLCLPVALVEDMVAGTNRSWTLHALDADRSLEISPRGVHYGTAGGAVEILDFETGKYRETTLADLYDVVRLIDTLPNIGWCYRPLIARDMTTVADLDINTAYALATGTTKPWGITLDSVESVIRAVALFDMVLGGEGRFGAAPCCHMVKGAGVPPLRFSRERCEILDEALRQGMPVMIASAPQAGATAPAALAGTLVQVVAEVLAGLAYVNVMAPGHPLCFSPWPFVSDLRTGGMTGGGAEQALLMAAAAQMADFYGLPCSVAAAMTDSKVPDAQSGSEKAYTTALAGLAGANMIHESAGMQASLLGCAFESFVIDDDMLGNVIRLVRGIEVTDETLSLDVIAEVNVGGPGHYLEHTQTLALMRSEYRYPAIGDRSPPGQWEENGARDIAERARDVVAATLRDHYPDHIDPALDARIRDRFDIKLPRELMSPGQGRWK